MEKKNIFELSETNWFSRQDNLCWQWILGMSLVVAAVFSVREKLLILLNSDWPHLYGVVGVPILHWEEIICYLPFATEFPGQLVSSNSFCA